LLRILCQAPNHFSKTALLVQKEVAEKVCAGPGDMSKLSVSVQYYAEVSLGQLVPAELFTPPPKVDSQILQLAYRSEPLFADVDAKEFFRVVKAGYSQRRKTLLNTLSGGLQISRAQATEALEAAQLSPQARAQTLTLDDWHNLYLKLS
jgi:16S rRNA (adenine1518-N6/adenine1519-N6)-dimethyltransferase